jgi:hypothetical protein
MADNAASDSPSLVQVFQNVDPTQVRIARDLLEGGGIQTFIFDGETARMLGSTVAIEARLMVPAESAADALARLKELGFVQ